MITEESVREVIETARIEDVVGDYVNLKRRGNNYSGLCPFHNEKTPSFNVNPARNIYKCFGCGVGGDPVKFLMELEQLSFPDAIRRIAGKYNLKLEEKEVSPEVRAEMQERDSLLIVNDFARKFFEDQLHHTDEGKSVGLSYFKSRGFLKETMETFGLGYAPDARDALYKAATAAGFPAEQLDKLGLARRGRDFFIDRVMFTIHNLSGKPIAFAGRVLRKDVKAPKYVNSPETEVYHKSDVLYGMFQARQSVRKLDNVYMVEGYTDVISLHQNGIQNVVATSGTSLTPGQARLVKRFTENVTLLYDGDKAGIKAALRGVDVLLLAGLNVRVVILPDGEDPDSYMQSVGSTKFQEYLETTRKDFLFFKADLLLEEAGDDVAARTGVIREVGSTLALVEDPIKRQTYIQQFAQRLGIEESLLINLVNQAIATRRAEAKRDQEREARRREREARRGGDNLGGQRGDRTGNRRQQTRNTPPPRYDEDDGWAGLVEPGQQTSSSPASAPDFNDRPPLEVYTDAGVPLPPETATPEPLTFDEQAEEELAIGHTFQEQHLAHLLIRDGHKVYDVERRLTVAEFLLAGTADVRSDFDAPKYLKVVEEAASYLRNHGNPPNTEWYLKHREESIRAIATTATLQPYSYSPNWKEKYGLHLSQKPPAENQRAAAEIFLRIFRMEKVDRKSRENVRRIRELEQSGEERKLLAHLKVQIKLDAMRKALAEELGTVVFR